MLKVRLVNRSKFYSTYCEWCKLLDFPIVAVSVLPKECLVCSKDGIDIYSVWLYKTNSCLLWLAWPLTNREAPKELKAGGLDFLFAEAEKFAKERGFTVLFTTSNTERVIDSLIENKFQVGDVNVNQFFKHI